MHMKRDEMPAVDAALAAEIDHLAEDLLDAADAIERLTRKYSEDVQTILKLQAENVRALARPRDSGDDVVILEE